MPGAQSNSIKRIYLRECRRQVCLGFSALLVFCSTFAFAEVPNFATTIYPILERSCFGCHGPDKQKSGYRIDVRDWAIEGGDSGSPAVIPHDSQASLLIQYVSGEHPDIKMPPEQSSAQPLSPEEVVLLRAWIDHGPVWPDEFAGEVEEQEPHWSLLPLVQPVPPGDEANPIDGFIRTKLTEKGLSPSPEASRRSLIRRVYFDLIGLPPTPEEVDAFIADENPDAYEMLVDRLLASPHYGERWARHWFDTIQFADSHGYEHDLAREHAWPYRDYMIQSFNDGKPWSRLIREQLAVDFFYPDEPELTPALGYLGAGPFDLSTYITAGVTFDYLSRDLLVTQTMASFVSTTANCARCHNHKFDPIPQADYYALQAVFSGVIRGDVAYDTDVVVKSAREELRSILAASETKDAAVLLNANRATEVNAWLANRRKGGGWTPLDVETFQSTNGAKLVRRPNGIMVSTGPKPEKATYTITGTAKLSRVTALRLHVHTLPELPMEGPGRNDNGNFHLSEIKIRVFKKDELNPVDVDIARASADFNQEEWGIDKAFDGKGDTAWGIHPVVGASHLAVFELATVLELTPYDRLTVELDQLHGEKHLIGAFSIEVSGESIAQVVALPAAVEENLRLAEAEMTETQWAERAAAVMRFTAEDALAELPATSWVYGAGASVDIPDGADTPNPAHIDSPKVVHRFERGEFDKPVEEVGPGALSALAALPARFSLEDDSNEAARRAALADWIASPDNVLTWRSIVNRVWHYHFGAGLCDSPSDLGRMGGKPSHPRLIDWLAVWFRDDAGESLKALHRLIVTSQTYRQSSQVRENAVAVDERNRLLWRQNQQRLDAEAYRDYTLAVAGRLDLTTGGPGDKQFTSGPGPQLTPALDYAAHDWAGATATRRSIYRFVWRGIADPFMEALDFPDLGLPSSKRGFSASALQASTLYNNDFVLFHSEAMAARVLEETTDLEGQITRAVRLVWHREPSPQERAVFLEHAYTHGLAALCRVLLNSNEYLFID